MTTDFPSLAPYGWNPRWEALFADAADRRDDDVVPARVVRHDGVAVMVAEPDGVRQLPVFASIEPQPVVGDWVVCTHEAVVATLDRTSLLRRRDPGRPVEQPLVANVDVVLVVNGLDRPVRAGRIRRAIATAWDAGAVPVVVLTKADRFSDADLDAARATADEAAAGIDVVVTSAVSGRGIDELRELAVGKTIVLLGESGAGKSRLTNALVGLDVATVGDVRESDTKGRHTTTTRQIHLLPTGGVLVDTPGVRALGLWADPEAVAATFDDLEELATTCRFNDCRHGGEPGCAIAAAVAAGEISPDRVEAWLALRREAEALDRRSDPRANRAYGRHVGRIAKDAQRHKGRDQGE
ncbi:MAG TPA: ribosome small subunit-dependent GTPase A [Acidimicrobiales bacterium]|nr:ribosome small subunit-dependent GTPase A [Acidimicrobiales bacterium]